MKKTTVTANTQPAERPKEQTPWEQVLKNVASTMADENPRYSYGDNTQAINALKLGIAFLNAASPQEREKNAELLSQIQERAQNALVTSLKSCVGYRGNPQEKDVNMALYASEFLARIDRKP